MGYTISHAQRLIEDYKKFKGFRPCGMVLEKGSLKKAEPINKKGMGCNMCPTVILPPCRDWTHDLFDPKLKVNKKKHKPFFRPCRPDDFEW